MILPGKEKLRALVGRGIGSLETRLNSHVASVRNPRAAITLLVATGFTAALIFVAVLHFTSSEITGVGFISSPTVLESSTRALNGKSIMETFVDARRKQSFLDSVDRFGIERMEEIYSQQLKMQDHD